MRIIQCPDEYLFDDKHLSVFLAGGITGCYDWQKYAANKIKKYVIFDNTVVINPRRENFGNTDPKEQIEWEYRHLNKSDIVLFWFPQETLCPIALYELGRMSNTDKMLFVGTHPDYQRRLDIIHQLKLANKPYNGKVYDDIDHMLNAFLCSRYFE